MKKPLTLVGILFTLACLIPQIALATADPASKSPQALYKEECGSCHVAYPPGLLPKSSWKRIVGGLSAHFGENAALDERSTKVLGEWLSQHAATSKRTAEEPPQDRITKSRWFAGTHHELSPSVWKRASIKSASNCSACHTTAERGIFDEDYVRIPR